MRLSAWDAFRFNLGVMRAARRARAHTNGQVRQAMKDDHFGVGFLQYGIGTLIERG